MEVRKEGERGEKEGRGKVGRPSRKDVMGRERSWSMNCERSIEEFMERKREREEGGREKRRKRSLRRVG